MSLIQPRVLKGFRDQLPSLAIPRHAMLEKISKVFTQFGYVPIETPALEYTEILLGKGSDETDKQLYRFEDQGGRDVALRFDLTVPLARFAAMHMNQLGAPFRRYHIAPVWRAEKPQRGRYREFTQCDFDIIGSTAPMSDAEIISIAHSIFSQLEIGHKIRINHRQVLGGFLSCCGADGKQTSVLRAIDKLEKLGEEVVREELKREADLQSEQIDKIFAFLNLSKEHSEAAALLGAAREFVKESESGTAGIDRLSAMNIALSEVISPENYMFDLSIARGLDYYTGVVFETMSSDRPDMGSICSGGRYDNLAGLYTKQELPGVGGSVGLDRTLAVLEEIGRIADKSSNATALLTLLDPGSEGKVMKIASELRKAGAAVEMYPEPSKLAKQLKYANRKGISFVIIAGSNELDRSCASIKDLDRGEQHDDIPLAELPVRLQTLVDA